MSNVRAIGQPFGADLWHGDCIVREGPDRPASKEPVHEQRNPSGRPDPADTKTAGARPAACAGDVCRRGRGSPDYRPGPETAAGGRRLPDQRRPVRLRPRHPGTMHRLSRGRHPPAGHDGRHLRLGRPDAVDGRGAGHRIARHLRLCHCCRNLRHRCRAFHQPAVAAVSAGGHRHHHPGDRHLADASRYQLGRRRPADPDQGGRRRPGVLSQPQLRPVAGSRHCAVRAAGDSRPDQMGHRFRRQRRGAARHRRRRRSGERARRHAFRQGRGGLLGFDRDPRSVSACRNSISCPSSPCAS